MKRPDTTQADLLRIIASRKKLTGEGLKVWSGMGIPHGTFYTTLSRLASKNFITKRRINGREVEYKITSSGRLALKLLDRLRKL